MHILLVLKDNYIVTSLGATTSGTSLNTVQTTKNNLNIAIAPNKSHFVHLVILQRTNLVLFILPREWLPGNVLQVFGDGSVLFPTMGSLTLNGKVFGMLQDY